jgi:hypothetical protein
MSEPISISEFRRQSGSVFSEVIQGHRPRVIRRGRDDVGLLVGHDEILAMLADRSFHPQVVGGDGSVSIWLPEFEIYGQGDTYAEAKEDLVGEARVYIKEYLANVDQYRRAPNRSGHFAYVIKAQLADIRGELEQLIFPAPPDLATLRTQAATTA